MLEICFNINLNKARFLEDSYGIIDDEFANQIF